MLALILAATITLPEIRVDVGQKIIGEDVRIAAVLWYGGTFYAENENIAAVRGAIVPKTSGGDVDIEGLAEGETRLMVSYVSGLSVWHSPAANIIVSPCRPAEVTLAESEVRVLAGEPVTLQAMTGGTPNVRIEWREGDALLGTGTNLTVTLPRGVHRITANVENPCGRRSVEADVTVYAMRRRTIRH